MIRQACMTAALTATMAASPGKPKNHDVHFSVSDQPNVSKVLRADTDAFFHYVQQPTVHALLAPYLQYEGVIQGDPHAGQIIPLLVQTTDGHNEIRVVDADFDNVGEGAFIWEFVHNVAQNKAIDPDIKIRAMLEEYLDGIDGRAKSPPKQVQEMVSLTYHEYQELRAKYVAKNTKGLRLKRQRGSIIDYKGSYTLTDMQQLFPEGTVLDFAHRLEDDGGNTGERIWILLRNSDGDLVIKELKENEPNSLVIVRPQRPLLEWMALVHATLWPGLNPETYDLVKLKDGRYFWRREKAVCLLDVPRSSDNKKQVQFRRDVILFDANFLGVSAGSQVQGAAFARAIRADKERFIEIVKLVVHPYLDAAAKIVK